MTKITPIELLSKDSSLGLPLGVKLAATMLMRLFRLVHKNQQAVQRIGCSIQQLQQEQQICALTVLSMAAMSAPCRSSRRRASG